MKITVREQANKNSGVQEVKNSLGDILGSYAEYRNPKELARLFEKYMQGIGARKLDRRRKDTANTYRIVVGLRWNWTRCYYYKNSGDWQEHRKFTFSLKFIKTPIRCFLIETGNPNAEIKQLYGIVSGTVLYYDRESLLKLIRQHPELFVMLCEKEE